MEVPSEELATIAGNASSYRMDYKTAIPSLIIVFVCGIIALVAFGRCIYTDLKHNMPEEYKSYVIESHGEGIRYHVTAYPLPGEGCTINLKDYYYSKNSLDDYGYYPGEESVVLDLSECTIRTKD
jgi:hypothetical protein